jgi:hypothetical protein
MKRSILVLAALATVSLAPVAFSPQPAVAQSFRTPSPYPIAWQFDFTHSTPKRIVVKAPGDDIAYAYWYMTYKVTNNTREERMFLPLFELMTKEGKLIRANSNIPPAVFDTIKQREGNHFLEPPLQMHGVLRLGEDQARESVAIWREPHAEMGSFSIFVTGLSGESVTLKDSDGNIMKKEDGTPFILRKTLRLNYIVRGDAIYPGEDDVNENPEEWVMR